MGDSPEPKVVVKKAYKCGEDEATLPNRFGKKANTSTDQAGGRVSLECKIILSTNTIRHAKSETCSHAHLLESGFRTREQHLTKGGLRGPFVWLLFQRNIALLCTLYASHSFSRF